MNRYKEMREMLLKEEKELLESNIQDLIKDGLVEKEEI